MPETETNNFSVPLDTSWFNKEAEKYLTRDDFKRFEGIAGVQFRDLLSGNEEKVRATQRKLCR